MLSRCLIAVPVHPARRQIQPDLELAAGPTGKVRLELELEFPRFDGRLRACRFQPFSGGPFVVDG